MRIYCDGSLKDGVGAIGIVVVDHNIILHRDGYIVAAKKSTNVEIEAIKASINLSLEYPIDEIYTDYMCLNGVAWNPLCPSTFTGALRWIPREKNQIAHGMATLAVEGFDFKKEISIGNRLVVVNTLTPMNWNVKEKAEHTHGYHTVHIHKKKFYCDCENFEYLSKCKFSCKHIWAVKKKINIINDQGEGMF